MSKKLIQIIVILLFCTPGWTQDTIYLNSQWKNVKDKKQAAYFRVINNQGKITNAKTYCISGAIKSEQNYILKGKKRIYEGTQKHWYKSGELHILSHSKKGKNNGDFISYWKSGELKRKDIYKNGKLIEGKCFNKQGQEVTYYDFEIKAKYKGGNEAMTKYLQSQIIPGIGQGRVQVKFNIDTDGSVINPQIIKSDNPKLNDYCIHIVQGMPKWTPAYQDGIPVKISYTLPLNFAN